MKPVYDKQDIKLYHGDAVKILLELQEQRPGSIDAVITDPPYSSGGRTSGERTRDTADKYVNTGQLKILPSFAGDNKDQRGYLIWSHLWMLQCHTLLKEGRPIVAFCDWRQLPLMTDAIQSAGFIYQGIVTWNKGAGARPRNGFKNQAEFAVWGTKGRPNFGDEKIHLPGVFDISINAHRSERRHQVGKPIALLEELVRIAPVGGVVLDPFAGSGTTLHAARRRGLGAIGIEIDAGYVDVASSWLDEELVAAA